MYLYSVRHTRCTATRTLWLRLLYHVVRGVLSCASSQVQQWAWHEAQQPTMGGIALAECPCGASVAREARAVLRGQSTAGGSKSGAVLRAERTVKHDMGRRGITEHPQARRPAPSAAGLKDRRQTALETALEAKHVVGKH